jgi:hypothetical protein
VIHEGQHSFVQISEWLGHSTAMLLANYAHVIADVAGRSLLPSEHAINRTYTTRLQQLNGAERPASNHAVALHVARAGAIGMTRALTR